MFAQRPLLCAYVAGRLREDWSPEQIAGTLYKEHPQGSLMRVSDETISKTLFIAPQRAPHRHGATAVPDQGRRVDCGSSGGGRHWTQLATVVERTTGVTVLVQRPGREMHAVTAGLSREMGRLPAHVRRSLTWDRGMELANHHQVTANTGLDVYFDDDRL